jgi:hypothetical protein
MEIQAGCWRAKPEGMEGMVEMHPRYHVDLHGLTLAEAEAKTREMIDAAQQEELELYELALRNIGR